MKIKEYFEFLMNKNLVVMYNDQAADSETQILNIAYHTDKVCGNTLFFCKGEAFKEEYARSAVSSGAVLLICDDPRKVKGINDVAIIIVGNIRQAMSEISAFHNGYPDKELFTIGITGTKGKTTTAYFVKTIIDDYTSMREEKPCGIFSSVDNYFGRELEEAQLTTPESPDLFNDLRIAVDSGIKYLVMEASSQGLKYDRVDKMHYKVGIFLNISKDHISAREHPTFEDYFESKKKIFPLSENLIINRDCDKFSEIADELKEREFVTFSLEDESADYYAYRIKLERDFISFRVRTSDSDREFMIGMKGEFNVANALAAIAACDMAGIPSASIQRGLMKTRVPGRMEFFSSNDGVLNVVVDYAHNVVSYEALFQSLIKEFPDKKRVLLFGCPGYKAFDRRVDLPSIGAKYSDFIFISDDDSGKEDADSINRDVVKNLPEGFPYEIEMDREKAVLKALNRFGKEYLVVLAGKGAECTLYHKEGYVPYKSDKRIVMEYIEEYNKSHEVPNE